MHASTKYQPDPSHVPVGGRQTLCRELPSSNTLGRWRALYLPALGLLIAAGPAAAQNVSFTRDVQPLLAKHCFACHGPDAVEGGVAFHQRHAALAEADSGEYAITPHQPDQSGLIERITTTDPALRMPLDEAPLPEAEVAVLREWIADGAAYEKHWAFVPREKVVPPELADESWVRNPIDRFVFARLEAEGLSPAPPADPQVLVRRVYYDVTGLPPTREQVVEFVRDPSPHAYTRLVDRLLASPHYGEKWARHWLDVVRYAESNSFERDAPKPYAWKYRDYVIRSLNEDKPYDQFVREQIAGDELHPTTSDGIVATGYYRLGAWDDEPADPAQARFDDLDDIVSTTGQAFLGLTVGCARCHDHKIDPFPQKNYYQLLAFFADVTPYALPRDRSAHVHSLWDLSSHDVQRRRTKRQAEEKSLLREKTQLEEVAIARMDGPDQPRAEGDERQSLLDAKLLEHQTAEERDRYADVLSELEGVRRDLKEMPEPDWALSLAKCNPHPTPIHVLHRGSPHAPGEAVEPGFPDLFGDESPRLAVAPEGARSAGRRRVLANWIADPANLLTSRVITNRVWQHHFGRGIVRSANNFGLLGDPPTHPKLLDWLAGYLIAHDWRLKELHRLLLTSNTYQMSSRDHPEGLATDPDNNLFWRFNMRRLTAEEIRDSVLRVSGQLNDKQYGPSVYPKLSDEVLATQSKPGKDWPTSPPRDAARRSIYIHIKKSVIPPELAVFDFPDTDSSCEARFNTTQAAQALNLLHSGFIRTHAGHLAESARAAAGGRREDQVRETLWRCLQREPDEATVHDGVALIDRLVARRGLSEEAAFQEFCLMVMNLNEFAYLD